MVPPGKPLRWGIAGFGWVARDYMAPAIAAAGDTLVAVADPALNRRAEADALGARGYGDVAAMLDAGPLDALYVATPNHLHLAPVREAATCGVAVLCEKPMAAQLADAEAIAEAVTKAGILYGTAFDQRHHPAHVAMRAAIESGLIGRPVAIRIAYCCWVDPLWTPPGSEGANWRADPKAAGGGAVVDLAPHGLDLADHLLGTPVEQIRMVLQRRVHDYAVEDGGLVTGLSAGGVLVSLHVSYNCPEALPRRRLEVLGETGQLLATNTMGQTESGELLYLCGRTGTRRALPFDAALSPFTAQAAAFGAAMRGAAHDYDVARDLALHRRFDTAYQDALRCL